MKTREELEQVYEEYLDYVNIVKKWNEQKKD